MNARNIKNVKNAKVKRTSDYMVNERTSRYRRNYDIVQEIANDFGFAIHSFDSNWSLVRKITTISKDECIEVGLNTVSGNLVHVDDEFMGRLAILLGYNWEFLNSVEKLNDIIKLNENDILIYNEMNLTIKKTYESFNKINNNMGTSIKLIAYDEGISCRYKGNVIFTQNEINIRKKLIAAGKGR